MKEMFKNKEIKVIFVIAVIMAMLSCSICFAYGGEAVRTELKARQSAEKSVTLSWDKIKKADGYEIYRKIDGGKYERIKKITSANTLKYIDKNLKYGKTYYYKVRSYRTEKGKTIKSDFSKSKKVKITYYTPKMEIALPKKASNTREGTGRIFEITVKNEKYSDTVYIDSAFVIEASDEITSEIFELKVVSVQKKDGTVVDIKDGNRVKVDGNNEVKFICRTDNEEIKYNRSKCKVTLCFRYKEKDYVFVKLGNEKGTVYTAKNYLNTII